MIINLILIAFIGLFIHNFYNVNVSFEYIFVFNNKHYNILKDYHS